MPLTPILFAATSCPASEAVDATPMLPGQYAVGVRQFHAEDTSREDPSTATRQFMVSVFYPASANATARRANMTDFLLGEAPAVLTPLLADDTPAAISRLQSLELRCQRDLEPIAQRCPVLIYYPGGQGHRFSNAGICESLASLGYVVFSLDAPRDAPMVVFPNGQVVTGPLGDENYIWPRVADVRFLLDELEKLEGPLANLLDLSRIGMFGASRGGYLSNICAVEDSRINAAVNMDGFLWGLWTDGTGLEEFPTEFQTKARSLGTPILRLKGEQKSKDEVREQFETEAADFGGVFHLIAIQGFAHRDFGRTSWLCGDPSKIAETLSLTVPDAGSTQLLLDLLRDFFDTYLRGERTAPLFSQNAPAECEVFSRAAC